MAQPFMGEIRMFAGNFAPAGWALCNGQEIPISENDALFVVLGTTYGGDGESTFRLPDLQSRVPMHHGTNPSTNTNYQLGSMGGTEQETLTVQQIATHTHPVLATNEPGTVTQPTNAVLAAGSVFGNNIYGSDAPIVQLHPSSITPAGGSQPHENTQPFLCINFIISLFGLFPSPN